jgi:hypothetical protein
MQVLTACRDSWLDAPLARIKGGGGGFGQDAVGRALRFDDAVDVGVALYDDNGVAEAIQEARCPTGVYALKREDLPETTQPGGHAGAGRQ